MRRFRWLTLMSFSAALLLTACGDDGGGGDEDVTDDMTDTMIDTTIDMEEDMGDDQDMVDPCDGISDCAVEGTSCDGDSLVTCAADANGCLVETTEDCTANSQVCDDSSDPAVCLDPCEGVTNCDTEGARSCDGSDLVVCEADANGCLVENAMDCTAGDTNMCDDTGAMAVCATDPCLATDGSVPADACDTAGTSCDTDTLVSCSADAFGCLKETTTDCTTGTNGTCDDSGMAAICASDDTCMDECTTEGETVCNGNTLVTCQADAFGCLVNVPTDCTTVTDGYCDSTTTAMCAIDTTMRCDGKTLCQGSDESATCAMDTLTECTYDMVGCLVETVTDCTADGNVCKTDMDGDGFCGPACTDAPECTMGASEACVGNSVAICADDNMDGCLEYTETDCMTDICDDSQSPVKCVAQGSGDSCMDTIKVLGSEAVASGTDITADFTDTITMDGTDCVRANGTGSYEDIIFEVPLTAGQGAVMYDLGGLDGVYSNIGNTCGTSLACVASQDSESGVVHIAQADETVYFVAEPYSDNPSTTDYEIVTKIADNVGTFAAGDTIADTMGGPLTAGDSDFFTITFSDDVLLSGTLDGWTTGDGDVYVLDADGNVVGGGGTNGTEAFSDQSLAAGTYIVQVNAYGGAGADVDAYTLTLSTAAPVCGDGLVTPTGEQCDDGNMMASDGCDASCQVEMGYNCSGEPSVCYQGSGDSCADPILVPGGRFRLTGTDFEADFTDTIVVDDASCSGSGRTGSYEDAIFQVDLAAGETVLLQELSSFDGILSIITTGTCGDSQVCDSSIDFGEDTGISYTATGAETVYLVVEPYSENPFTVSYDIMVSIESCGDGVVVGSEECDDGNNMGMDGCTAACNVETGYICAGEPSVCTDMPITASSTPGLAIPDDAWPSMFATDSVMTTGTCASIIGINLDVDITHTYKGDVVIELVSPAGTTVTVEDGSRGGSTDDIVETYPTTLAPVGDFSDFNGENGIGTWTLNVGDDAAGDTGTLNSWGVSLICQ